MAILGWFDVPIQLSAVSYQPSAEVTQHYSNAYLFYSQADSTSSSMAYGQ
ncbi:MAG: hypothetical protein F6J90_29150 [Moorea sp. SIOASIH]|nr:hypothetical protein [Moorena sp. SIOASIH]NEO40193.1 hypothetical protein [Moorena sp. SIOASIH]